MAQNYEAVEPLVATLRNLEAKYNPAEWLKSAPKKQDTSWHDEMVRKATESFTKPTQATKATARKVSSQQNRHAGTKAQQRKGVQKKMLRKR